MTLNVVFKDGHDEKIKCWVFCCTYGNLNIMFDDGTPDRRILKEDMKYFGGWSDQ